jgi:DNA polymerase-3 subunit beta
MEFRIARDTFSKALQRVQGIVETRKTMPILSNVLIEAADDRIAITATDLEVGMKSTYPADVKKDGKITVSAKKLYEIIRELPEEEIFFGTRENDWVDIICGKARFNIVGLSPEEFPFFPVIGEDGFITLDSGTLNEMVEKTAYAICHDETKYNLNGIFVKGIEKEGKTFLMMVATDGHRLSLIQKEFTGNFSVNLETGVIFPRKGIQEVRKLTEEGPGDLMLSFIDNSSVIKRGDTVLLMRLVDGEFPDYTRVLPISNDRIVTVNRNDFLHSLKRMSILSSDKFKGIKLEIESGGIEISANNPELGEARENLDSEYSGDPIAIRFNARYLVDVLGVVGESEVELHLKDELSPAILKPVDNTEFLSVIMPMRL